MQLCFYKYAEFSSPPPPSNRDLGFWAEIEALGLGFVPCGWFKGLGACNCALRLGFGLQGQNWASRLGFGPLG